MNRPSSQNPGEIFDLRRIRRLVELMNEHGLSEVDLQMGDTKIRLRRDVDPPAVAAAPVQVAAAPAAAAAPVEAAPEPADEKHIKIITSPMVGTFYASSSPDSPAFVKVGDSISADSTVCIIEAMKVFNEIPAEVSGKVVAVLVENEDPVEFGQPLFRVDTRA